MKRIISLIIALCLVLGSFSYTFAAATQWDTSDQTNLSNIAKALTTTGTGTLLRSVNSILTALTSHTEPGSLYNGVVYLYDIREYARQIASGLNGTNGSFLEKIYNALVHSDAAGIVYSYVTDIYQKVTEIDNTVLTIGSRLQSILTQVTNTASAATGIYAYSSSIDSTTNSMYQIMQPWYALDQLNGMDVFGGGSTVTLRSLVANGFVTTSTINFSSRNWRSTLGAHLNYILNNTVRGFGYLTNGYASEQTYTTWNGSTLSTATFTPNSTTNGVYSWLSNIQTPLARLAFVHASDEEIEARLLAEANQTAVVDDFIDPSGTGSVGVSDFGSLSDASGAMKSNFNTGQSASGVFNVFDDQHFGYLSQGTADSLDTTGSNTRLLKASGSEYPTPTLDRYYEELNQILEVNADD